MEIFTVNNYTERICLESSLIKWRNFINYCTSLFTTTITKVLNITLHPVPACTDIISRRPTIGVYILYRCNALVTEIDQRLEYIMYLGIHIDTMYTSCLY